MNVTPAPRFADVSYWQGQVDWQAYADSGRSMAVCKATQGEDLVDSTMARNRGELDRLGLGCGLYHFAGAFQQLGTAEAEADHFLGEVGTLKAREFPVLDFEQPYGLTPAQQVDWISKWCTRVQEKTGKSPWIYTNSYMRSLMEAEAGKITMFPLWIANYHFGHDPANPPSSAPWPGLAAWQHSSTQPTPGIGRCDESFLYAAPSVGSAPPGMPAALFKEPTAAPAATATARPTSDPTPGPPPDRVDHEHPWNNQQYRLEGAHNAHRSNTTEELARALARNTHWLEGDVRAEIDHPERLEMRHDEGHERGDNLSLDQWLQAGEKTGRGLKLDLKESVHAPEMLDRLQASGIPGSRLMLNLDWGGMEGVRRHGADARRRFPQAILAINPPAGDLDREKLDRMAALADRLGGPITFVLREDKLSDEAVTVLRSHGSISIWNRPGFKLPGDTPCAEREAELRRRGVDGMIDLRPDVNAWQLTGVAFNKLVGKLHDWF